MESNHLMKSATHKFNVLKTGWTGFFVRFAASLVYLVISVVAQHYFDATESSRLVRCVALIVWIAGLALVFIWLYRWLRRADEYQRMLMYRSLAYAMLVGLMFPIVWHIVHVFLDARSDAWPIMAVPSYAIVYAVIGSWPQKS